MNLKSIDNCRIASISAAKATSSLIPLCHNIPITKAETDFEVVEVNITP